MEAVTQSRIMTTYRVVRALIEETFRVLLVGYILLLVLDQLIPGFASFQMNLNALLWAVIITGLITIAVNREDSVTNSDQANRLGIGSHVVLAAVSLVGAYVVFSKLGGLGDWRIVAAILTAGLTYLLGSQLLNDNQSQ